MNIIKTVIRLLLVVTLFQSASANQLIDKDSTEVAYFFSYHCPGCFAVKDYVSLWSKTSSVKVRRIPVFDATQWENGARLYVISSLLNRNSIHSQSVVDRNNFKAVAQLKTPELIMNKSEFLDFIKPYYQFSLAEFNSVWGDSDDYMTELNSMLNTAGSDTAITTPSIRISNGHRVIWINLQGDVDNPGLDFVSRANKALKELSNAP